ncbi:MAG: ATP-dependent helicase [Candidatus Limnocylindrales bacterium]
MSLHPEVEERLARLAPDQRAAATAPPGPVLCIAPAGSGKTTTLVARICWLVANGADPGQITAVTFNKRAAEELGERLASALAPIATAGTQVRVRTFHALGREILAEAGVQVRNLVGRADVVRRLNGKRPSAIAFRRIDDAFSRLKLDLMLESADLLTLVESGAPLPVDPDLASAFVNYEEWLAKNHSLDFDDLVRRALTSLRADHRLREAWQARCQILLVDEVQDVDRSQLELALVLTGESRDVFLVGDDDQTIYAWRLADVRRVLDLAASLPGLRRVDLVTNYRCPRAVVERAVRLVEGNHERFAKEIKAAPTAAGNLLLAADPGDDVARARRLLTRWLPAESGKHAVLARTNAELAPFAAIALEMGIPYRAGEDGLLLDDPIIDALLEESAQMESRLPIAVALARQAPRGRAGAALLTWSLGARSAYELMQMITEARERRGRLRRDDADLILATAHGTKGLEFDHVACIGLDDGVFPSRRTLEDAEDPIRALEEERRLAYVAWTRAKRSLTLVYDPAAPSVFLREAFSDSELGITAEAAAGRRAA